MAVRPIGGYDPDTGWPPDDSTDLPWQSDTALPGQFQGGGAGFGPGGFRGAPRLTAPASGPTPGMSLSANPGGGAASVPPEIFPPVNSTIPPNKSVGPFTGGTATDAIFGGARRFLPKVIGRRIPFADIVTPTDELAPPSADEAPPWSYTPGAVRPVPRPAGEPSPSNIPDNLTPRFPAPTGYPPTSGTVPNFVRPEAPITPTYPSWPTPPAPAPAAAAAPGGMPWAGNNYGRPAGAPIGSPAPAVPVPRPRAVSPGVARQRPNLGAYGGPFTTVSRPNANPGIGGGMLGGNSSMANIGGGGARGTGGAPTMTALDLSRLFSRQQ